ncbi:MAG: LytTR family transcriptional regulator DNA-binding domain-containing protein [Pedobacter sp.]|uniref:LytR/AlgR family response regulator transcription factor n=1 Tax=Pedobacter sp. TaxID=1411316 RepID=UPI002808C80B|nr:LytTR family transcriptional regulator DNA-binding domain-containing protein [Pedobacter sp.]MDQ8003981.1 LytTR family transcriptional regulator DNA-binding domain-containing protein [Pedobacter sp.]
MSWKTIIIEDEQLARQRLKRLLANYDEIEIIAEAENGLQGLELINKHQPDLIFLDIEMPILNGFEMLAKLSEYQPKVVFTTAYDQYAIKAFDEGSIDYLLKPIELERLDKTIHKLKQTNLAKPAIAIEDLLLQIKGKTAIKTLTVKLGDRILLIKIDDIIHIQAEDKYVFLHTNDGKKHLTDYTLSVLETKLPDDFLRIHRSDIINTNHITEIRRGFNGALIFVMSNGAKITSSRSNSESLRLKFGI